MQKLNIQAQYFKTKYVMKEINFPLLLVIITGVSGCLYLYGILHSKITRKNTILSKWWYDYAHTLFPIFFIVLAVRSFLFEPFQIPSASMLPNLKVGDFIIVNKYSYGLRLPVVGHKFIDISDPQRGDIVVFKFPGDESINFIKRLIGLPGDEIRYHDKQLYVNDKLIEHSVINQQAHIYLEKTLDMEYPVQVNYEINDGTGKWKVQPDRYFVMGDNRDNSHDSRYWGTVPDNLLIGKAVYVWMQWPEMSGLPNFSNNRSIE
jgi:signal peptidase I